MKKLLIVAATLGLAACGQSTPSTPQSINVSGGWTGTITTANTDPQPLQMQLSQQAGSDDFTGLVFNNITSANATGKVSTGIMDLVFPNQGNRKLQFIGTFTPTTYKGAFSQDGVNGTFSFTKNQ